MTKQLAQALWFDPDAAPAKPEPPAADVFDTTQSGITLEEDALLADPLPPNLTAPVPLNLALPEHFANVFPTLLTVSALLILFSLLLTAILLILGRNNSRLARFTRVILIISLIGLTILIALRVILSSYFTY